MSATTTKFRFRPRFLGMAFLSLSLGVILVAAAATLTPDKTSTIYALVTGVAGLGLAFAYLRSPVWRLAVEIDDDELVVWNGLDERLRLPFRKVDKVVVGIDRESCYVDGGDPDHSLLVPGPGAQAPYTIRHKAELIEEILSRVPESVIQDASDPCITDPKD